MQRRKALMPKLWSGVSTPPRSGNELQRHGHGGHHRDACICCAETECAFGQGTPSGPDGYSRATDFARATRARRLPRLLLLNAQAFSRKSLKMRDQIAKPT